MGFVQPVNGSILLCDEPIHAGTDEDRDFRFHRYMFPQ